MADVGFTAPVERTPLLGPSTVKTHAARTSSDSSRYVLVVLAVLVPALLALPVIFRVTPHSHTAPPTARAQEQQPATFFAIGDWGRRGHFGQRHVAEALASAISEVHAPMIISTGDNFYSAGVESAMDDLFNSSFESVYHHPQYRSVPWIPVLGNHDYLGSVHAQLAYTHRSDRWHMPAAYFTRRLTPNLVAIFLDTTPFVQDHYGEAARQRNGGQTTKQLAWLRRVLANLDQDSHFMIIAHHNMYTLNSHHFGTTEIRDAVEPILKPYRRRMLAYISGHEHVLSHMRPTLGDTHIDHFISGAGSKLSVIIPPAEDEREKLQHCCGVLTVGKSQGPYGVWGQSTHGFFVFQFDGNTFRATAKDKDNRVIYEYSKTV